MGAPWTHPTRLWHPSSPCLVGRGYRLSENWWEKNTRPICLLYKCKSLYYSSTKKQTCRKGNGPVWCWDATLHEHRGSRALGGSPAAPARPDHEAAAPPGHTSTNMAGSPGSASTNTATTAGSPGLGKSKQALNAQDWDIKGSTARQKIQCELHQWWRWQPYCSHSRNWQRSSRTRVRWRPRSGRLPLCSTRRVSSGPKFWVERMQRVSGIIKKAKIVNFAPLKYIICDRKVERIKLSFDTNESVRTSQVFVVGVTWHNTGRLSREWLLLHRNSPFSRREQHIHTKKDCNWMTELTALC